MRFLKSKKGLAAVGALVVAVSAVGAYAYFATTGSGNGTAASGSAATGQITLHTSFADGLVPGASTDVTFTADNSNLTTSQYVNVISFGSVSSSNSGCQAVITAHPTQFSMTAVTSGTSVPAGASAHALSGTGSLVWSDSSSQDQTACAGKPLTLNVTSN